MFIGKKCKYIFNAKYEAVVMQQRKQKLICSGKNISYMKSEDRQTWGQRERERTRTNWVQNPKVFLNIIPRKVQNKK